MKKQFSLALALACLATTAAHAAPSTAALNNEVRVYAGANVLDYKEYDSFNVTKDGILDSEKGTQPVMGLSLSLQGRTGPLKNVFLQVDASRTSGTTRYKGYLQGGAELIPYENDGTVSKTTDISAKLGYALVFNGGREQITPYVAVGTHKWLRDSSGDQYGYREDYSHKFAGIGAKWQVALTPSWALESDVMAGRTSNAKMVLPAMDTTLELGSKSVTSIQVAAIHNLGARMHGHYGVEYNTFAYGISPAVNGVLEPDSKSHIVRVTFGLGYGF
jgi:hypothetical protein